MPELEKDQSALGVDGIDNSGQPSICCPIEARGARIATPRRHHWRGLGDYQAAGVAR